MRRLDPDEFAADERRIRKMKSLKVELRRSGNARQATQKRRAERDAKNDARKR